MAFNTWGEKYGSNANKAAYQAYLLEEEKKKKVVESLNNLLGSATRNARKISNGVDPLLINVKPPTTIEKVKTVATPVLKKAGNSLLYDVKHPIATLDKIRKAPADSLDAIPGGLAKGALRLGAFVGDTPTMVYDLAKDVANNGIRTSGKPIDFNLPLSRRTESFIEKNITPIENKYLEGTTPEKVMDFAAQLIPGSGIGTTVGKWGVGKLKQLPPVNPKGLPSIVDDTAKATDDVPTLPEVKPPEPIKPNFDAMGAIKRREELINKEIESLRNGMGKGVTQGGLVYNAEGEVINRFGRVSNNEPWYREFYKQNGRRPNKAELRQIAIKNLSEGYDTAVGTAPPDDEFMRLWREIEAGRKLPDEYHALDDSIRQIENGDDALNPEMQALVSDMKARQKEILDNPMDEVVMTSEPNEMKVSKFKTNTLTNSEFLQDPEIQNVVQDVSMIYEVKPNAQTVDNAYVMLSDDFKGTMDRIADPSYESLNSAEDAAASGIITNTLRKEAQATGDYTQLTEWLTALQPKITSTAQSLQALSTWKTMTVEGALIKLNQVVGKVNRDITKKGLKTPKVKLTPEDTQYISDLMTQIEKMPEGRLKEIEFAKVKKFIASKVPVTLAEQIKGLHRISMLINPKTLISRNMGGNIILNMFENFKDIPGALADIATSKVTGQRTTMFPSMESMRTQKHGMEKGFKRVTEDIKHGVDTSELRGQYDLPHQSLWDGSKPVGKALNFAHDTLMSRGLQYGDRPFAQAAYDEALRQQKVLNKTDIVTPEMEEFAKQVAKDRTFQNDSSMARAMQSAQNALNKAGDAIFNTQSANGEGFGLGNVVIPFPKTPGNILDKAVDYSPVGYIRALGEVIKGQKGTFNQKAFVDQIGRSTTGSGLILLGYYLAQNGVITGKSDRDHDVANTKRSIGLNPYSFNSSALARLAEGKDPAVQQGDTIQTYDFAQPISVALAIGADIYNGQKERKPNSNTVIDAIKSGGTTLFNQSVLQGVQKMFGGYDVMSNILDTVTESPLQFIPTLSGQVAKTADPYARETYDPNVVKQTINKGKAKIPGLSKDLPIKIDTLGRPVQSVQGGNSIFNTFINPGITRKYELTPAEDMVMDIYNKSGQTVQFPRLVDKSYNKVPLTTEQYVAYQQLVGQKTLERFNKLAYTPSFRVKKPEEQAELLKSELTKIDKEARKELGIGEK